MSKDYKIVDKAELKNVLIENMDDIKIHVSRYYNNDRYEQTFKYLQDRFGIYADNKSGAYWLLFRNGIFSETTSKFLLFIIYNILASLVTGLMLFFYDDLGSVTFSSLDAPQSKLVIDYSLLMYRDLHTMALVVLLFLNPFDKQNFFKVKKGEII